MENNTLKRFMELLSVPSKTYHEDRMVNYLMGVITKMDGVSVYNDDYGNIYATKGILTSGY
jgi:di/tripeptidase